MRLTLILAAVFAAWLSLALGFIVWDPVAADYSVFWHSSRLADPYHSGFFPYPPSALILLQPLRVIPFSLGYVLLWAGSLPAFYFAARLHFTNEVAFLSLCSAAAVEGLVIGQFAMLFAAAILWAMSYEGIRRGAILSIVGMIKPQLLLLAPLIFLVRKDWTTLAAMAISGLAMVAISLFFGPYLWLDWVLSLNKFHQLLVEGQVMGRIITPSGIASTHGLEPWPYLLAGIAAACAAAVVISRRVEAGALACVMVGLAPLAAPYALPHDTLTAVPLACVVLLRRKVGWLVIPALFYFAGHFVLLVTALVACAIILWSAPYFNRSTSQIACRIFEAGRINGSGHCNE